MEHKVHFVVAVFGRDVDHFTLHIYVMTALRRQAELLFCDEFIEGER
jgi:hypothetical protein